ncbi:hypothetical protein BH10CYA1_BH10CYA1_27680 [soil metagenome]
MDSLFAAQYKQYIQTTGAKSQELVLDALEVDFVSVPNIDMAAGACASGSGCQSSSANTPSE